MPPRKAALAPVPESTLDEVAEKAAEVREETPDLVEKAREVFAGQTVEGLHAKLAQILREMPKMTPEGKNPHFRYSYWSTDQVTGFWRARFGDHNLSLNVDVESYDIREAKTAKGGSTWLTTLVVAFIVTDADSGQSMVGRGIGQGDDPGDKGANKAMTGALKYWLMKIGLMGGEDAEADEQTDKRAEARAKGAAPQKVKVEESKIEGIQRGGKSTKATDVQVKQVAMLVKDLDWSLAEAARRIADWAGDELELSEDPEEHGNQLRKYLESLDSADIGKIITRMIELRDEDEPDQQPEDVGYLPESH